MASSELVDERYTWVTKVMVFVVVIAFFSAITAFCIIFYQANEGNISLDVTHWGASGDFIGGLFNPFISLVAVVLLARTYAVQKAEFASTTRALSNTARDAERQANIALIQAQIDIVASVLAGKRDAMANLNNEMRRVADVVDPPGTSAIVLTMHGARLGGIAEREAYMVTCRDDASRIHADIQSLTDRLLALREELDEINTEPEEAEPAAE